MCMLDTWPAAHKVPTQVLGELGLVWMLGFMVYTPNLSAIYVCCCLATVRVRVLLVA